MFFKRANRNRWRTVAVVSVATLITSLIFTGLSVGPNTSIASAADSDMTLTLTLPDSSTYVEMPINGTVTGTVNIDWGDTFVDSVTSSGNVPHTYATDGTYTVTITGMFSQFGNCSGYAGAEFTTAVTSWGSNGTSDFSCAFSGATSLISVPSELPTTTAVTNLASMFQSASSFNSDIGNWNTANVTNMENMFQSASSFNSDIRNWNTTNVTNFYFMFARTAAFNQPIGNWNTENVTKMTAVFYEAVSFNQPLNWNTSNVTDMDGMFQSASSFNSAIGNWNTANVTKTENMFRYASSFNSAIGNWNTANVTNMEGMFENAVSFNRPLNWETSKVSRMRAMFRGASSFNQDLANWDIGSTSGMAQMLDGSGLSTNTYSDTIIGWAAQTPSNSVAFGASGLFYNQSAVSARGVLTSTYSWVITGDTLDPTPPSTTSTTSTTVLSPTTAPTTSVVDPEQPLVPQFTG